MASVKSYKFGDPGTPKFPDDFEILKKAVLQVTDLKTNHNKYYGLELHEGKVKGALVYRVFTHYGRTDDLETNPNAGQKEVRFAATRAEAEGLYREIYGEKTSARKGYKELALASSKIGSGKARGTSSGAVDAKTIAKIEAGKAAGAAPAPAVKRSELQPALAALVKYLYDEATEALTTTVQAKITAEGIETPLGVLTIGQIEKGEAILDELYDHFKKKTASRAMMESLSSDFYTMIPHRIGRSRAMVDAAVIDTLEEFHQKQETLQLMKDMLQVNGDKGTVLYDSQLDGKYDALKCELGPLERTNPTWQEVADLVQKSQLRTRTIRVQSVYSVKRPVEHAAFAAGVPNQRLLFHGSRIKNWVGILSRGILLPKIVVSLGVNRTDAGWLGSGIYFGDASCTSAGYTSPGRPGTRFLAVTRVALGNVKDFTKITYGLSAPPAGFHSCHGVRARPGVTSQFADDEYVIYDSRQQRLEYLVEFKM
ncbi:MAG: WGR domain-containing protein [Deltaproteobacteria bacterium]|nr:WGR domain-containing protein [Deltaproteobacteria bacterium]